MHLISAKEYENAGVYFLRVTRTGKIWTTMKNVQDGLGDKNMSDLVLKEIHGVLKTKLRKRLRNLTKEQIKEYKMTEREIFEKFVNLSEDELNTKSNKNVYVKNDVITTVIERCWGEKKKKKGPKKNRWIQEKVDDSRI